MRNFQDTFETYKRSFINAFSICMAVPLNTCFFYCPKIVLFDKLFFFYYHSFLVLCRLRWWQTPLKSGLKFLSVFDPIEIRLHEAAWWPAVTIRSKKWAKKSFRPLYKIVTLILSLHKKCSFQFQIPVDLDKFTEEILNGKLHFLCSVYYWCQSSKTDKKSIWKLLK